MLPATAPELKLRDLEYGVCPAWKSGKFGGFGAVQGPGLGRMKVGQVRGGIFRNHVI